MSIAKFFLVATLAAGVTGAAQAGVTYANMTTSTIGSIGSDVTTTYGNVFTVAGGNARLDSFSFFVTGSVPNFYAGVASWTGTGAGAALFTSPAFSGTAANLTEVTVNTGGLDLVAGQQYVAYFSVAGMAYSSGSDVFGWSDPAHSSVIANGIAWDNASGGSPNHAGWNGCEGCSWGNFSGNMSFSEASAVPEPGSLALLGLGAAGLLRIRRRKSA